jgi:hypothetical protein
MMSETPYRVVDRENQGWHSTSKSEDGERVYAASYGFERGLPDRTYLELARTRAPLRPVEPVTDEDVAMLHALFAQAGRKAIATLASALEAVFHRLREQRGGLAKAHESYEFACRTLKAGREGSWESELLIDVVMFGNSLNLAPAKGGASWDVAARRAGGPSSRVHATAQAHMTLTFWQWVTGPDRYTEVAETLAAIVSSYCDAQEAGWKAVADQWLQPSALAKDDFRACYRLFYSTSEHFDSGVI